MDSTVILEYTLGTEIGNRIAIHKSNDEYVVTSAATKKAIHCLGLEHAREIFYRCVAAQQREAIA